MITQYCKFYQTQPFAKLRSFNIERIQSTSILERVAAFTSFQLEYPDYWRIKLEIHIHWALLGDYIRYGEKSYTVCSMKCPKSMQKREEKYIIQIKNLVVYNMFKALNSFQYQSFAINCTVNYEETVLILSFNTTSKTYHQNFIILF